MRNLALLIRKDFINALAGYGYPLLLVAVWLALVILTPNFAPFMFIMFVYVLIIALFSTEENDLVCNIAGVLPIRKSQRVVARYLYSYAVILAQVVVACICCPLVNTLRGVDNNWLPSILLALAAALLLVSVNIPLIYAFGVMKMRIFTFASYIVLIAASGSMNGIIRNMAPSFPLLQASSIAVVVLVVLSVVSLAISLHIMKKR